MSIGKGIIRQKNISVINAYRAVGIILVMFSHFTVSVVGFFDSPILPYIHKNKRIPYLEYIFLSIIFNGCIKIICVVPPGLQLARLESNR